MASFGPTPTTPPAVAEEAPAPVKKTRKAKAVKTAVPVVATEMVVKKKRARTAFLFYSNANRAAVREAQPGIKITEAAVILGAQWKALSDADKAPYLKLAAEDKARIEAENKAPTAAVEETVMTPVVEPPAAVVAAAAEPPVGVVVEPLKGKKRTVKK